VNRTLLALVLAVVVTIADAIRRFVKFGRDSEFVRWLLDGDPRAAHLLHRRMDIHADADTLAKTVTGLASSAPHA